MKYPNLFSLLKIKAISQEILNPCQFVGQQVRLQLHSTSTFCGCERDNRFWSL